VLDASLVANAQAAQHQVGWAEKTRSRENVRSLTVNLNEKKTANTMALRKGRQHEGSTAA
jgi:hypothetical protein